MGGGHVNVTSKPAPSEKIGKEKPSIRQTVTTASQATVILGTRVDLIPATDLKPGVRERAERDLVEL
jgi:hypothetical protein